MEDSAGPHSFLFQLPTSVRIPGRVPDFQAHVKKLRHFSARNEALVLGTSARTTGVYVGLLSSMSGCLTQCLRSGSKSHCLFGMGLDNPAGQDGGTVLDKFVPVPPVWAVRLPVVNKVIGAASAEIVGPGVRAGHPFFRANGKTIDDRMVNVHHLSPGTRR